MVEESRFVLESSRGEGEENVNQGEAGEGITAVAPEGIDKHREEAPQDAGMSAGTEPNQVVAAAAPGVHMAAADVCPGDMLAGEDRGEGDQQWGSSSPAEGKGLGSEAVRKESVGHIAAEAAAGLGTVHTGVGEVVAGTLRHKDSGDSPAAGNLVSGVAEAAETAVVEADHMGSQKAHEREEEGEEVLPGEGEAEGEAERNG